MRNKPAVILKLFERGETLLQLKRLSYLLLTSLLLVQPVFAEESDEPVRPDIISAVRTVEALPSRWNPLTSMTAEKQWLLDMTTAPLYTLTESGSWEPVLAGKLPEDVTADYAGTYGIPADAQGSYAYRILLRSDACWEDSSPITAEDCVFSIQKLLENEENRGNWTFLANAEAIISGAVKPGDEIVSLRSAQFTSMQEAISAGYSDFYIDTTHFWGLEGGWLSIYDRSRMQDFAMPDGMDERFVSPAYLYTRYLADGAENSRLQREFIGISESAGSAVTMDDLGIISVSSSELVLITQVPTAPSVLMQKLENLFLFHESCWGKDFATSAEAYCGYGPYRISAADSEQIILEPNPNWWGSPVTDEFDRIICRTAGKD